jgi:hypothetical protein
MLAMASTETSGDKDFHSLTQQLFTPIPEQHFSIAVNHDYPAIFI